MAGCPMILKRLLRTSIPPSLTTPSTTEYFYSGTTLDGPKVGPVNGTTWDWWYFDAISSDLPSGDLSSVIVVFYNLSREAFLGRIQNDSILLATISSSHANNSNFIITIRPDDVYISTLDDSSSGQWGSGPSNASWSSTPDLRTWTVNFNTAVVNGSMKYSSVASPHLPCGLPTPGATEEIVLHIGWANAVPDAMGSVDFTINGTDLQLAEPGYHDKKWANSRSLTARITGTGL
ncbi:hypothetical protein LTR49_026496 [Elasticomyces elasticus]|nr:hypothetical protein LTR49_026496 [Elasticomyces elasticus]